MNRRNWLATLATASTTCLTLLAGCSAITGGDSNDTDAGGNNGTSDATPDPETDGNPESRTGDENGSGDENGIDDGATTPEMAANGATASDQALDTGQAPPSDTGTLFENTNTVPEEEGLETGQAPNATDGK